MKTEHDRTWSNIEYYIKCFWILYPTIHSNISFTAIHREKAPSKKIPVLTKNVTMDIWIVVTTNELFYRGS